MTSPTDAPHDTLHPLVQRLVREFGARVVTPDTFDAWAAEGGDRVLLLGGDAVRFPEALDVAVVLPELQRAHGGRFAIGVATREHEETLARRHGAQRWPALLFLRDGRYVTALAGMHDWTDYVARVGEALAMAPSRAPSVGIPVVGATAAASTCH
jgi:hydrogenase-1 operon protein HyaE